MQLRLTNAVNTVIKYEQTGDKLRLLQRRAMSKELAHEIQCLECGGLMEKTSRDVAYYSLEGTILEETPVYYCKDCGDREVVIRSQSQLNQKIARELINKDNLNSEEIEFLRKYIDALEAKND